MDKHPAVLLMAYGSPNSLDEVGEYLRQVRGGRLPAAEEVERLKDRYRQVGGQTPLLKITLAQAKALEERLRSERLGSRVYVGMKHWHPFIEDVVEKIVSDGAPSIIGLALAPHYSKLSIGGYSDSVKRGVARTGRSVPFTMVESWHDQQSLISALSRRVLNGLQNFDEPSRTVVLFTAHSLPKKFVREDDPYWRQLQETSHLVAGESGIKSWDFAFQSAGHPIESWMGPSIREKITELSGKGFRELLVCPVGFVSDHLEILYDLDIDARGYAWSLGVRLERTVSLNDDPEFINAISSKLKPLLLRDYNRLSSESSFLYANALANL
ncbi:MAG: ferrochelatase [Crenarchaeota archaeon 13_1_40CM_3_52_10]|nr:MAG: ferrochelatase [Crenarchaeota archaeon 13_1_40CM_3_52_10]OLE69626.1 MAG: ferrochelatase [archaeon 13_1_20CM_2_51_12]